MRAWERLLWLYQCDLPGRLRAGVVAPPNSTGGRCRNLICADVSGVANLSIARSDLGPANARAVAVSAFSVAVREYGYAEYGYAAQPDLEPLAAKSSQIFGASEGVVASASRSRRAVETPADVQAYSDCSPRTEIRNRFLR